MTDSKRPAMSENSKGLVSRMYFKILYINKKNTSTSVEKKLKDYYEEAICQRRISTAIKHMKRYSSLFVIREKQVKTRALSAHLFIWQKLGSWSMPNICGDREPLMLFWYKGEWGRPFWSGICHSRNLHKYTYTGP